MQHNTILFFFFFTSICDWFKYVSSDVMLGVWRLNAGLTLQPSYCVTLATFLCFGLIIKIPRDQLQGIQITCVQAGESDSWLRSGSSLGHFLPSQSQCDNALFVRCLKEVGNGTQGALTFILNLFLTYWEPHPLRLTAKKFWSDHVFLAVPNHSREETVFVLAPPHLYTFSFDSFIFSCRLGWPVSILLLVRPQHYVAVFRLWTILDSRIHTSSSGPHGTSFQKRIVYCTNFNGERQID